MKRMTNKETVAYLNSRVSSIDFGIDSLFDQRRHTVTALAGKRWRPVKTVKLHLGCAYAVRRPEQYEPCIAVWERSGWKIKHGNIYCCPGLEVFA